MIVVVSEERREEGRGGEEVRERLFIRNCSDGTRSNGFKMEEGKFR